MKLFLFTLFLVSLQINAGVLTTKHNLSTSGPGSIKAGSEQQVCIFCHAPHSAAPMSPLWNRATPGSTYTPYSSSSIIASPGQPTGASLLCLSCHDGTIAIGEILSQADPISMTGSSMIPQGKTRLGTDLSDDHPVSFVFDNSIVSQNSELVSPSSLTGKVKLDKTGQMQCTSCHDPHDDSNGKFLVMQNTASALCKTCHQKQYWNSSSHSTSNSNWNGQTPNPWPTTSASTVASNACENCHT
ncbi:MAG: cytochrome c3 family protein, partial [Gammaproteobacteria bacterium]|nr:cytochrome c3 family protein [Gammaproteobacteria bacterium]